MSNSRSYPVSIWMPDLPFTLLYKLRSPLLAERYSRSNDYSHTLSILIIDTAGIYLIQVLHSQCSTYYSLLLVSLFAPATGTAISLNAYIKWGSPMGRCSISAKIGYILHELQKDWDHMRICNSCIEHNRHTPSISIGSIFLKLASMERYSDLHLRKRQTYFLFESFLTQRRSSVVQ